MNPKKPLLAVEETLQLIEDARNAEIARDLKSLRKILQRVWDDDNCSPSFDEYLPAVRAELLRLFGFYLTTYGLSQKKKNYQERGKDLLTTAIGLFESCGLKDKAAEANVILAFCYWNSGEVAECEALLKLVEAEYLQNVFHPVWLQIRINRLMVNYWNEEFDEGIKLIEEISPKIEFCADIRLKTMFHNHAGMIFRRKMLPEQSAIHYQQAMRFARESNNLQFEAGLYNNLSLLHRDNHENSLAHLSVDEAIKILESIDDGWFLPLVLDTKASIFIAEGNYPDALATINKALHLFERSEDFRGLAEALWTKTLCLLRLDRSAEAFIIYSELQNISRERIGQATVEKFARALSDEIYVVKGLPLLDEVAEFKKAQVTRALIQANGLIVKAAEILGLKNHKTLSQILNRQFPELRDELGFGRRAVRSDFKYTEKKTKTGKTKGRSYILTHKNIFAQREITRIVLPDKNYSFDFKLESKSFETFYFKKSQMQEYGIDSGAVVAVFPVSASDLKIGLRLIVSIGDDYVIGTTCYDEECEFYFILDSTSFPVPLNEANIVGEPVGYCPIENAEGKFVDFSRLKIK